MNEKIKIFYGYMTGDEATRSGEMGGREGVREESTQPHTPRTEQSASPHHPSYSHRKSSFPHSCYIILEM